MKTLAIVLAAALAALVPATAYAATAAPSSLAAGSCDQVLKTPVECAVWVLKCVGDSLGGNACHQDAVATAAAPPEACDVVDCGKVVGVVRCVGDALGGHACHAETAAATPDPEAVVACAKVAVRNVLEGVTPEPCTV